MSTEVDNYLEHMGLEVGDELKHYGKKGMKWGVRNDDDGGKGRPGGGDKGPSRKERRAAADAEINDARDRQRMRGVELERQAFKTYSANGQKAAEAAVRKYDKMNAELLSNPDATTAAKMTSGEKAASAINLGIGLALVVGVAGAKAYAGRRI